MRLLHLHRRLYLKGFVTFHETLLNLLMQNLYCVKLTNLLLIRLRMSTMS
jgi:hypothetical protein